MDRDKILGAILKKLDMKYKYIKYLGGGTFSNVYLVKQTISGADHALKAMNSRYILQMLEKENIDGSRENFDKIKIRFIQEAALYKRIDHPNIVKIHNVDTVIDEKEEVEIPYLIMDYIKGPNLKDILKNEAPLELNTAMAMSKDILKALAIIHQNGIVHRDLKPANIMVEESGKAILVDFGIAKDLLRDTKLTTTGLSIGSPIYMSPEQFMDSSRVGPRLDIYSFGVVLYEMLAGKPPFYGRNFLEIMNGHLKRPVPDVREMAPGLPAEIDRIIKKAMAKKEDQRFQNAEEMLNELINIE